MQTLMIITSSIEVGWFPGYSPRKETYPDITLEIRACYWHYGKPMSRDQVQDLKNYLKKLCPVFADYFFEYHHRHRLDI
jgi:hypothetical protein